MATVKIENISKSFGTNKVHDNISLTIKHGECFTILGPSGCGKTVLMRMIAGFENPDKGKIFIGDTLVSTGDGSANIPPDSRDLGVVFQDYAVWPHMTVYKNIAYPLKIAKKSETEIKEKVMGVVDLVNLNGLENRLPSQLSGGQQQRVALGRALVGRPSLMLLDEPLNNLDANLREEMRFEIKELQTKLNITVIYVTHDQEIALALSDRIAIMDNNGNIVQVGTPTEVFEHPANDFVFKFLGVANFLPTETKDGEIYVGNDKMLSNKPEGTAKSWTAAFRPSDVILSKKGSGLKGKILRASFLGADMDYLVSVGNTTIRTITNTYDAISNNLIFKEGEECIINFHSVNWFDSASLDKEAQ